MERVITIYWRDIPSRVIGRRGRKSLFKQTLDSRFDRAIERASRRAGGGSSKKYLEDWRRESQPCTSDLELAVAERVSRLEGQFPPDLLERVVRAAGIVSKEEG